MIKPRIFFPILLAAAGLTALMLLMACIAAPVSGLSAAADPDVSTNLSVVVTSPITLPWQTVVPGIDYVQLTLTNPSNHVYIARMRRDILTLTLDTSVASGYLADGQRETVSQQAARYNQAINYWGQAPLTPTWGSRNDVLVAINGFYYDKLTGYPWNGMIQSGWYIKRFDDLAGLDGFAWKLDRSAFIGECSDHVDAKQLITFSDAYSTTFQGINITPTNHTVVIYTPQYAPYTGPDASGTKVQVQLSRPLLIVPPPKAVTGTITAVYTDTGSIPIPFDSVVVSIGKAIDDPVWPHLQVGQVISISQEIKPYKLDCTKKQAVDWGKTYASLGAGYYFLHNGIIRHYGDAGATDRNPRTAIVYDNTYVYFMVVDGRSWLSQGMTIDELANFVSHTIATTQTLTATFGIAQDGGGSSTLWVNGQVKNNTVCNNVFCTHYNFLPLIDRPSGAAAQAEAEQPQNQAPPVVHSDQVDAVTAERYVANGVMMLVVEPMQASTMFTSTQEVATLLATNARQGPGANYASFAGIPKSTAGVIVHHPLNGVLAKGAFWWLVRFNNGVVGWVSQSDLAAATDIMR